MEEFARRGEEIFERDIRPHVQSEDPAKFVLIDIETGDYEIDADEMTASDRLLARRPDAQVWFRRVGSPYAHRFVRALYPTHRRQPSIRFGEEDEFDDIR
jgi:hypothetical protein